MRETALQKKGTHFWLTNFFLSFVKKKRHRPPTPSPDPAEPAPSSPQQAQQYTYGSFNGDIERQSQLSPPRPQDLWPLFLALVVLGCFLIFLVIPLVAHP
jgi:hypothetical protein